MIYFKTKRIETNQKTDELLSRLTWQIHPTKKLLFPKTSTYSADTDRPFIGKLDLDKQRFVITRLRPLFQNFLPQVFATGQFDTRRNKKILEIKYGVGIYTFGVFLFIFIAAAIFIWKALTSPEMIVDTIIYILVFPLTAILLTFWEINKTTNELFTILEFDSENGNAL
jgi:hypothetical protein